MKQSGKGIQNENLQEFLDSAKNAAKEGQQQFYTLPGVARAICSPLCPAARFLTMDLHFGNGALAAATGASRAIGIDIDPRVAHQLQPPAGASWDVTHADLTNWYPIASEAGFTAPVITINPPFSLQWHASRLALLRESSIPEVAAAAAGFGAQVDSTLASFLIALDLLAPLGEGLMVCNAATARRLFASPQGTHPDLRKFIWLWLEIPGAAFENLATPLDTAVLYFSRSHGRMEKQPLFLSAPSADPTAISSTLAGSAVQDAHRGSRLRYQSELRTDAVLEGFHLVAREHAIRHRGRRPDWNIMLDAEGRIRTFLTPFQKVSRKLDRDLIARLHSLNHQDPVSLCVTATSRTALREARDCGVWRIQPAVGEAIAAALGAYARDGAPFYPPNEVMALGWVDDHGALTCLRSGIGDCQPGQRYVISSTVESTTWKGQRINLVGEEEDLAYTGRELLVKLEDTAGCQHHFHVRLDDSRKDDHVDSLGVTRIRHWHIGDLLNHFQIPVPADIATLRQEDYQANLARIGDLQRIINHRLAAA